MIWKKINDSIIDGTMGIWWRRYNRELYYILELPAEKDDMNFF